VRPASSPSACSWVRSTPRRRTVNAVGTPDTVTTAATICTLLDHAERDRSWLDRCRDLEEIPHALDAAAVVLRVLLRHVPDAAGAEIAARVTESLDGDDRAELAEFMDYVAHTNRHAPLADAPTVALRITLSAASAALRVLAPTRRARRRTLRALEVSFAIAAGGPAERFEQAWAISFDPTGVDPLRAHLVLAACELHAARVRLVTAGASPTAAASSNCPDVDRDAGVIAAADAARVVVGVRRLDHAVARRFTGGVIALWAAGADVGTAAHHAAAAEALLGP
jgi:hypothetical protein